MAKASVSQAASMRMKEVKLPNDVTERLDSELLRPAGAGAARKREIRLRYDAQAESYDSVYAEEQRRKHDLIMSKDPPEPSSAVLDCGCGTGLFIARAADRLRLLVGVDISSAMLRRAAGRVGRGENVALVCADSEWLPFASDVFDRAFAIDSLPGVGEWQRSIDEITRTVKEGGKLTVAVPRKEITATGVIGELDVCGVNPNLFIDRADVKSYVATAAVGSKKLSDVNLLIMTLGGAGKIIWGRKRLHKIVYLLKEAHGISFAFKFRTYFYGSVSEDLDDALQLLCSVGYAKDIHSREQPDGTVERGYGLTEAGEKLRQSMLRGAGLRAAADIGAALALMNRMSAQELRDSSKVFQPLQK